jgi:homocitrate synthase
MPPFALVDTTLREGEQFATCEFMPSDRVYIAKTLDKIGVDYIEMVNPAASEQAARDCAEVARLGLRSKILTHTRCHMHDVRIAVGTGVQGVNLYMATSAVLSAHSHGKGIDAVIATAAEVIEFVLARGLEVRFSCEDAFRSNLDDILRVYAAVDRLGVHRVGVADTVGVATPLQVYETVRAVRGVVRPTTGIEFHTHNDTGCCIANALMALEAGATHIDTSVLGLGEVPSSPPPPRQ